MCILCTARNHFRKVGHKFHADGLRRLAEKKCFGLSRLIGFSLFLTQWKVQEIAATFKKVCCFTLQEGLQFLESSHNEIVYKTKKVEYILEKERRATRRESQPTETTNKLARFKMWITSKVSQQQHSSAACIGKCTRHLKFTRAPRLD